MSLSALLQRWRNDSELATNIVEWRVIPTREARFTPFPSEIYPPLVEVLSQRGIQALYSHQASAWKHTQEGRNLAIVTGTASGKTLCYNLPVLDRLLKSPQARALYLFPTKALSQDQLDEVSTLCAAIEARTTNTGSQLAVSTYDGDTPVADRPTIRSKARLVISNPDMLHTGILPHHTAWAEFLRNLQFVVIDEMHTYRGVFGSHVANVLRRLKRVTSFYGSFPQFILTSASIANPAELAEKLVEAPVALVDDDGSARGEKHFLIYNPPVVDPDLGLRSSLLQESLRLAEDLFAADVQTIIFGRTRRTVELILTYLRERTDALSQDSIQAQPGEGQAAVRGYRSGYLPRQRREIERGLRQRQVHVVVATTALELGIDIGEMEASLLAGYPGTIASSWQQAGRAGRGRNASLSVLVASANPLDQFLARYPEYFFDRTPERALINPDNLLILLHHLRCAAFELPFQIGDGFGNLPASQVQEFLTFLQGEGVLHQSSDRYFWMADAYPAQQVSLRSASPETIILHTEQAGRWKTIGQVDITSAPWMIHPGAVYLHEGVTYLVKSLDLEAHEAILEELNVEYYTEPRRVETVQVQGKAAEAPVKGGGKAYGDLLVTLQVIGFRKIRWNTRENLGSEELSLPPSELQTTGYWLSLAEETVQALQAEGMWSNAPNDYGPGWPAQRDRARARDGYRCQVCGIPEQGRSHTVHHKVPFRAFTSAEQANQLANLITLCPACHRRVETGVRIRSGLAGLAYVLGNLAPLFLMCDPRDLGIFSDPQSSISEGQPVVVIYDQVPAGIGFSERLYELHEELVQSALDLVVACHCTEGCPSCVGPGGENGYGGKREALALLKALAQ